jgi:hypothetical protein
MSEREQLLEWIYGSLDNIEKRQEILEKKLDSFNDKCLSLSVQSATNKTEIKNMKMIGSGVASFLTVVFGSLITWLGLK